MSTEPSKEEENLRPLLPIRADHISSHPSLESVPLCGRDQGLVSRCAAELGRDVEEAKTDARALAGLLGGGRLVAAPLSLEESLFHFLEQALYETLTDPAFEAAAATTKRSLDVARADVARADIQAATERVKKFLPIVQQAIWRVRG